MSVKILIDMNLSPDWVLVLKRHGWSAVHWSTIGDPRDLDFGTMLALSHATGPSVLQVRVQDILPDHLEDIVIAALKQHDADLASGSLIVVDESRTRVRILPI